MSRYNYHNFFTFFCFAFCLRLFLLLLIFLSPPLPYTTIISTASPPSSYFSSFSCSASQSSLPSPCAFPPSSFGQAVVASDSSGHVFYSKQEHDSKICLVCGANRAGSSPSASGQELLAGAVGQVALDRVPFCLRTYLHGGRQDVFHEIRV